MQKKVKEKSVFGKILSTILFLISIVALIKVYNIYKMRDFNDFVRAEKYPYTSTFTRDKEITQNDIPSFKIESDSFNDAMFYETVEVIPGTPYKVTCKVKTENVEKLYNNYGGGAQIAIEGTTERSRAISGTGDFEQLELYFDSKNRTEVNIGFRLGGYDNEC